MSDHLTEDQIEGLLARRLAPDAMLAAGRHLSECALCRGQVRRRHDTSARIASLDIAAEVAPGRRAWWVNLWSWRPLTAALAAMLLLFAGAIALRRDDASAPLVATSSYAPTTSTPVPEPAVVLDDGGLRLGLDREGNLIGFPALPEDLSRDVRLALAEGRLETPPFLKTLRPESITLMGEAAAAPLRLLAPVGVVLRDDCPVFRWAPIAGASQYVVTVLDLDFNPVATSEPLAEAVWRPDRALPRGSAYAWQVTARIGDEERSSASAATPESRFHILSAADDETLARRLAAAGDSSLLRGLGYAHAGLLADAEREFRRLARENPQSPLANTLLRELSRR